MNASKEKRKTMRVPAPATTSRQRRPFFRAIALCALSLGVVALVSGDALAQSTTSAPASAPSAGSSAGIDLNESRLADEIYTMFSRIPQDTKSGRKEDYDKVRMWVDTTLRRSADYLDKYPAGDNRVQVLYAAARLLTMNYKRRETMPVAAWVKPDISAYFTNVREMIAEGMKLSKDESQLLKFKKCLGQVNYHAMDHVAAGKIYEEIIRDYPTDPDADWSWMALINVRDKVRDYAGTVKLAREFKKRFPTSPFIPHIIGILGKSLTQLGEIELAAHLWESNLDLIQTAADGKPVKVKVGEEEKEHRFPTHVTNDFLFYLDQVNFNIGFCYYIQGKAEQAELWLQRAVDDLSSRQRMSQAGKVFLGRAQRVLSSLKTLQGKPAPRLDLDQGWLDGEFLDLAAERGNVTVLYFATYGGARYSDFAKLIEEYHGNEWENGFRAAWISIPKGRNDIPGQFEKLRAQRDSLGLTYPIGFDMSEGWLTYRAYNCAVGGGTVVVLDRAGKVAWYKMDPTFRDLDLARRVFDRLLSEAAPQE